LPKDHLGRVMIALIFLPVLYWIVRHGPPLLFYILVLGGVLIGQYELYRFYFKEGVSGKLILGMGLGLLVSLSFLLPSSSGMFMLLLSIAVMAGLIFSLFSTRELKNGLADSGMMFLGILYVSFLFSHIFWLYGLKDGALLTLYAMGITWLIDAMAYYTGSLAGRHPLAPKISPKKTVEGAVGGLAFSILGSLMAAAWLLPGLYWLDGLLLGLLLGTVGQLGDLVESLWKRSANVKDSSRLIPSHGGFLDKVDSLIFTVPVFYYYLIVVKGWPPGA
jgi:phosphatidate cytidylyltransferase